VPTNPHEALYIIDASEDQFEPRIFELWSENHPFRSADRRSFMPDYMVRA
jgi:hypothetical protein